MARPDAVSAVMSIVSPGSGWNRISPWTMRVGGAMSCMIERAAIDLPQPDSPTMHSTLLRGTVKSAPSTAFTTPSSLKM